jgi:hexosaminidase
MKNQISKINLIPKPVSVEVGEGGFSLSEGLSISYEQVDSASANLAHILADRINLLDPGRIAARIEHGTGKPGRVRLLLDSGMAEVGSEGYTLQIGEEEVQIRAISPAGIFRGIQTLIQLILDRLLENGSDRLPAVKITDHPRFEYRGMMLDVARHFFPPSDVKRLIDLLAYYKLNHLHLHLTDDQGWRIEIKNWPKLTEIGGSTQVGGGKGGFYTQAEYTDLVDYAQSRYITIVPEIDLPGHTNAALASYPELNCDGTAPDLYTGTEVGFSSLCLDKPVTNRFLEDVIAELAGLTPGPFLHIGGDEAHSTKPEEYRSIIDTVQGMVTSHGKHMVGWQEISHCTLSEGSIVQYWTGHSELGELQADVRLLMSPATQAYMDMKYNSECELGLAWAGYVNLGDAYTWDPETYLKDVTIIPGQIIGLEAPLWSETLESLADIEYMVFPRLLAYSELGWSVKAGRDFEGFRKRVAAHGKQLDHLGVNYYRSELVNWPDR